MQNVNIAFGIRSNRVMNGTNVGNTGWSLTVRDFVLQGPAVNRYICCELQLT